MSTFAKKVTSAVVGLALVMSMLAPAAGVSAAYSSLDAANKLATLGIIVDNSGAPAAYRLADTITREELSKVIANLGGLTVTEGESVYADTDFASWAEKYAAALNVAGYAASNAYFNPKFNATKIEALKWVMEARSIATGTGDNWMAARVAGAVEAGVAESFSDYTANVTRGQVFIWAANAIDANEDVSVDDDLLCSILGTCETTGTGSTSTGSTSTGTTTTVMGDVEVTLSPLSPTSGMVAGDTPRTTFLVMDVTAGDTDVSLKDVTLSYVGLSSATGFTDLALYSGNKKVTKQDGKGFSTSNKDAKLSFENDTVVQAGKTVSFVVSGLVDIPNSTVAHQIAVTDLTASNADVTIGTVKSVVFNVYAATNTASLELKKTDTTKKPTVGEEVTFADFSLKETSDNEDVNLQALTFEFDGGVDTDDIADLVLYADGVEVASNISIDSNDEALVDLGDFTIGAKDKVDFKLKGVVTGSIGETMQVSLTDVYAVGVETGIISSIKYNSSNFTSVQVADLAAVEGSEINVSWDKSDIDEARPDIDDVLIGTLNVSAVNDYTLDKVQVTVTSTAGTASLTGMLDDLQLDGRSFDQISGATASSVTYVFKDITVDAGEDLALELTADIADGSYDGNSMKFAVKILEATDETNDETYYETPANGQKDVATILSSNAFDDKTIDIKTASYTLTQSKVSERTLVLGNGVEVVLYQGKLNVSDSDNITLKNVTFNGLLKNSGGTLISSSAYDFEDIIDSATLNVGGVTADAEINSDNIKFQSADIEVAAGAKNVEILVTAVLKDNDTVAQGDYMSFDTTTTDIEAEDSDSNDVAGSYATGVADAKVVLNDRGSFEIAVVKNGDNKDLIDDTVLAGTDDVAIAELTLEAKDEDVDVNDLYFTIPDVGAKNFADTVTNARIMAGSTVIADGGTVVQSGSTTSIHFEDFTVEDTGNEIDAVLVVDLNIISTEGGVVSATAGNIKVNKLIAADVDAEGASSNDALTGTDLSFPSNVDGDTIAVVPALVTISAYDTFGEGDTSASIEVTIDMGDNDLDNNDVLANTLTFFNYANLISEITNMDNSDEVLYSTGGTTNTGSLSGNTVTFGGDKKIVSGDRLEIRFSDTAGLNDGDTRTMEIERGTTGGFTYTVDSDTYNATNDSRTSLGTYKK